MNESEDTDLLGKKIFFLHPSAVVQNEVAAELTQQEFEIYITKDHNTLKRALKRYPASIVFADIDERMSEKNWEEWIRDIMKNPETASTMIGILSANDDENLRRKYINMVRVQAGYTVLRADLPSSIRQILEILKTAGAKGRRKYIRAVTDNEAMTTINLPFNGTYVNGTIRDISVVGLSCTFGEDPLFAKNTLFQNIQIKLQSALLKVEGIILGSRMDGLARIYVILFTQHTDPEVKIKIRKYIQQNLQTKMDNEFG
ncbi:MAG: PilZ domain-containing protein [Treponema sp.]|jgi:L-rhamnose mutarotase|nr:PilZ domain-containing protein [Treponema sp.]